MIKIKLFLGLLCFSFLSGLAQVKGVGINMNTPSATLDVNGNLKIRTTDAVSNSFNNVSPLVIDNNSKELKIVQSSTGNTFAINYIIYHLNHVNRDWVNNFDTKINTTDYAVVVVGSYFTETLVATEGSFNPLDIYAFEEGGTWRIKADYYYGASTGNGSWAVYCLIINKSILKMLPLVSINMNGSQTGSAPGIPAGL